MPEVKGSSNIKAIDVMEQRGEDHLGVVVTFRGGNGRADAAYDYPEAPIGLVAQCLSAESVGRAVRELITSQYPGTKHTA
jgi:hypothetical protein